MVVVSLLHCMRHPKGRDKNSDKQPSESLLAARNPVERSACFVTHFAAKYPCSAEALRG